MKAYPNFDLNRTLTDIESGNQAPFPLEALPPVLRNMVRAVAVAQNVPIEFPATCIIAIAGAVLGKSLTLRYRNKITTPNLYVIPVAPSGSGKSQAVRPLMQPFFAYQAQEKDLWERETKPGLDSRKRNLENQRKRYSTENPEQEIQLREIEIAIAEVERQLKKRQILLCEDTSQEKLVELLANNEGCIFSYTSDAAGVINNLFGRITGLKQTDESVYLKMFSVEPIYVNRISRDVSVDQPCGSLLWLTTPDRFLPLLSHQNLRDGGFSARALFVVIDPPVEPEAMECPPPVPEAIDGEYRRYIELALKTYRLSSEMHPIKLTEDAETLMLEYSNEIRSRFDGELSEIRSFASRWLEQALKIALGLHAANNYSTSHEFPIGEEIAKNAITIHRWFASHQLQTLQQALRLTFEEKLLKAWEWIVRNAPLPIHGYRVCPQNLCAARKEYGGGIKLFPNARIAMAALVELTKRTMPEGSLSGPHSSTGYGGRPVLYFDYSDPDRINSSGLALQLPKS